MIKESNRPGDLKAEIRCGEADLEPSIEGMGKGEKKERRPRIIEKMKMMKKKMRD